MEDIENKILYIDDEQVNLALFTANFSKIYTVVTAKSTVEAEKVIRENQFKVVISDISMPYETGLDFFKRFRFDNFEPILIILTAFISESLLLEALNQGKIFRYLTKPWNTKELKYTIDQAIQSFDLIYQNKMLDLQIKESDAKFYNIFQYSRDLIIIFDENGSILEANIAFLEGVQKGYEEIKEMNITDLMDHQNQLLFRDRIKLISDSSAAIHEYKINIPGLGLRYVEANSCKIEYKGTNAYLSIVRDVTDRKLHEKEIFNAVIYAEEKERSRIAKDLHDGLGPILATLNMYLERLHDKGRIEDFSDILDFSMDSVSEAINTLKSISNNLSPHMLEKFGLLSAISAFVERLKKLTKVKFAIESNLNERLSSIIEISIYRVITECVNNSLKHSKSTEILIRLSRSDNNLNLLYSDNGVGFDVKSALEVQSGMGLHNIQNRIKSLGGKINIQSKKNFGTEITAEITI
jgi:PAS domain S-box-containing protein